MNTFTYYLIQWLQCVDCRVRYECHKLHKSKQPNAIEVIQ